MSEAADGFNPEYDPTGIEGGLDTNLLPWLDVPNTVGVSMKTVRASMESGMFSLIIKIEEGKAFPNSVFLGGMDLLVLSGELDFSQGGQTSVLKPGTWGFVPANTKIDSIAARGESEMLVNFFNGISILNSDGSLKGILTAMDVNQLAKDAGVTMVPSSLADCARARPNAYRGDPSPLAIAKRNANELVDGEPSGDVKKYAHDFFIDAKTVSDFQMLMLAHESIVSKLIGIEPVKEAEFSDYEGVVKSLGAWGGDFVLACGPTKSKEYFAAKGFTVCFPYAELISPAI